LSLFLTAAGNGFYASLKKVKRSTNNAKKNETLRSRGSKKLKCFLAA